MSGLTTEHTKNLRGKYKDKLNPTKLSLRNIDRLVAERVMGITDIKVNGNGFICYEEPEFKSYLVPFIPTESIADAFQVVEKMKQDFWIVINNNGHGNWDVSFSAKIGEKKLDKLAFNQESLPFAISKAALKAMGCEV